MMQHTPTWGFLTNHALVLIYVVRHNDSTVREISGGVGVTERATLAILRQLSDEGIVVRHRDGRRNTYAVNFNVLAAYRREGTVSVTPRLFVDGLIQTLLSISDYHGGAKNGASRPVAPDSGALEPRIGQWGFFTNHALLLLAIAMDSQSTVRELAMSVGVTERAVVAIHNQLEDEGVVIRNKQGRRNTYTIDFEALRRFPRWSPGDWELPKPLVEVAVTGLRRLVESSEASVPAPAGSRA
jgi:DNA-binding MarR family transcriptional regulator